MDSHVTALHSKQERLKCDKCDITFGWKPSFWRHKKSAHNSVPFKCDICDKTFKHEVSIKAHKGSFHSEIKHHCKYCEKECPSRASLRLHIRCSHEKGKNYNCGHCTKTFAVLRDLKAHLKSRLHRSDKPSKERKNCDKCNKMFNSRSSWLRHLRKIHDEPVTDECNICHKRFAKRAALEIHLTRTHKENKK